MSGLFDRFLNAFSLGNNSRYYYYRGRLKDKCEDLSSYQHIYLLSELRKSLPWNHHIYCSGHVGFGCSVTEFKRQIGRPQQEFKCVNELTSTLLVYRYQIYDYKLKSEFHFSGDSLFYFNRTFSYLSQIQKQKLPIILMGKYNSGNPIDFANQKIVDLSGNEIIISHNIVLSIDYVGKQESVWLDILNNLKSASSNISNQAEHESDRLYHNV